MRSFLVALAVLLTSACAGSSTAPSPGSSTVDVSGAWVGTFASSNNPTVAISVSATQSGSNVAASWQVPSVAWTGQLTGAISGSSLSGQITFVGIAASDTVCTGTAAVSGSAGATSLSLSSSNGVIGAACPVPLPVAIQIDLHR